MTYLKKANYLFRLGEHESAIKNYESALKEDSPLKSQILFNIKLSKTKIERNNIKKSKSLRPYNITSYGNQQNKKTAIEYYSKKHPAAPYLLSHQIYTIDIIIPVYNALEDVKKCLHALAKNTDLYQIQAIVVNDFSDQETTEWLRDFCKKYYFFTLIEHPKNRGYTKAINSGLKSSQADYVVTLNSDTIVTEGWLQSLVRCMRSDDKLGIVGPLSNAASWQNVPELLDSNKQFAVNEIPLGMTPDEMAIVVNDASLRTYPKVPFVNGFCFMISREIINAIGLLDEEAFPTGYGEENDYCIRAADAGFDLAIVDDAYVFHAKSKSFGHEKRKELSQRGSQQLKAKHTEAKFQNLVKKIKETNQLDEVRSRIKERLQSFSKVERSYANEPINFNFSVLFLLPVKGGGGGAHSVVQEAYAMRRMGINVHIAMKHEQVPRFQDNYSDLFDAKSMFIGFTEDSLINLSESYDIVIATLFSSVKLLKKITEANPHLLPAYYIQDYEPLFFDKETAKNHEATCSYELIPNMFCFAKTNWIIDKVKDNHGVEVEKVSPSLDHDVYKLNSTKKIKSKLVISAMIRPATPRRGAAKTMRLLSRLYNSNKINLEIKIFGCENTDPEFSSLESNFQFTNYGVLKRKEVSDILNSSDIFIDLSDYQAFGRTGLEAMACGAISILPIFGGTKEYAVHFKNSLLVNTFDEDSCFFEIDLLLKNTNKIYQMQHHAILTAAKFSAHKAALSELLPISKRLTKHQEKYPKIQKKQILIFPSLQKDNATPTASGYVRLVLPYQTPKVLQNNRVEITKTLPDPNEHSSVTLVLQRDVPSISYNDLKKWVKSWKSKGNKIIYDLDDDLFELEDFQNKGAFKSDAPEKVTFMYKNADLITTSTKNLKEKLILKTDKKIIVLKNCIDKEKWKLKEIRNHTAGDYGRYPGRPITIGYIGTPSHVDDIAIIESAMKSIEDKYNKNINIEVIGVFQESTPTFGKRVGLPKKRDYPNFINWLQQRVHWDIGVIPLKNDKFNKSKSYLKFLEYSALNMAIVVSKHVAYSEIAENNVNCLTASDETNDWIYQITKLIEDKELREKLSKNAFLGTIKNHLLENNSDLLTENLSIR